MTDFIGFPKIPRWSNQNIVITEKIDGTNAQIVINDDCTDLRCGSRNRWITPDDDNFGFARWVYENKAALLQLGKGQHFGEWWGNGIQRNYGLKEKRFTLFNTLRWSAPEQQERLKNIPVSVVPILFQGDFLTSKIYKVYYDLLSKGSVVAPGFPDPEGIVIYLHGSRTLFKLTDNGNKPKWESKEGITK